MKRVIIVWLESLSKNALLSAHRLLHSYTPTVVANSLSACFVGCMLIAITLLMFLFPTVDPWWSFLWPIFTIPISITAVFLRKHWLDSITTIPHNSVYFDGEGKVVMNFCTESWPLEYWKWDPMLFKLGRLVRKTFTPVDCITHMSLQPISANPKVRRIVYKLRLVSSNDKKDMSNIMSFFERAWIFSNTLENPFASGERMVAWLHAGPVEKWLRFHLYEFNEKNGRELAELYNPMASEQQSKFEAMIQAFFAPLLKDTGCTISGVRFSIP